MVLQSSTGEPGKRPISVGTALKAGLNWEKSIGILGQGKGGHIQPFIEMTGPAESNQIGGCLRFPQIKAVHPNG